MADLGRPSGFKPEMVDEARKLATLGATDIEVADFFEVNVATIYRWKHQFPDFCDALKLGKEAADERVKRALYAKATGYSVDTVKIFMHEGEPVVVPFREHFPPSDTAGIFWLKNRQPDQWRDKRESETEGLINVTIRKFEGDE